MSDAGWVRVCAVADVEPEDVLRFDHNGRTYAVFRTADERFYVTAGLCTHEFAHLAGGFVSGTVIECPKHNGRFDFTTGKALRAPACVDLKIYAVKVEEGSVYMQLLPRV
jgi:3-phenylpropionate/trans-cinnamate dioxygenase ferredoxin component